MLRIQRSQSGEAITLTISGGLTEEYLVELERVVRAESLRQTLILDLQEMTQVTRDGVILLAHLEADGALLLGCPEYLREWISREEKARSLLG